MNFADVKSWTIPEGDVIKVVDSQNRVIWEKETVDYTEPFYLQNDTNDVHDIEILKVSSSSSSPSSAPTLTIEYSTDNSTWVVAGNTSTTGLSVRIPARGKLYLKCNTTTWVANDGIARNSIITGTDVNKPVKCGGNLMSLFYGDSFADKTSFPNTTSKISRLFSHEGYVADNQSLIDASKLLLPVTTLTEDCYSFMFNKCRSLTNPPALPATTLANYCYQAMFSGCTSLISVPNLPATTLANHCYRDMFSGCTSLTTSPELPAATLVDYCYRSMFSFCTSLNTVVCLATDISAVSGIGSWLNGVSASGTFYCAQGMSQVWPTGASGIPSGWTVVEV